jgi:hypothetical protein
MRQRLVSLSEEERTYHKAETNKQRARRVGRSPLAARYRTMTT